MRNQQTEFTDKEKEWFRANRCISLVPISISAIGQTRVRELIENARHRHRFDGFVDANSPPVLVFHVTSDQVEQVLRLVSSGELRPQQALRVALYGWNFTFGAQLTFTFFIKTGTCPPLRVSINADHRLFEGSSPIWIMLFIRGTAPVAALTADFSDITAAHLRKAEMDKVKYHRAVLADAEALHWESLAAITSVARELSASEVLQTGWVKEFESCVRRFTDASRRKNFPADFKTSGLPFRLTEFLDAAANKAFNLDGLMDFMKERYGNNCGDLFDLFREEPQFRNFVHDRTGHEHCMLFQRFQDLYLINTTLTKAGTEVPTVNEKGDFEGMVLEPDALAKRMDVRYYWSRLSRGFHFRWKSILTGRDVPCDLAEDAGVWAQLPRCREVSEVNSAADALLAEANSYKKWTIPNGAVVQLPVDPFTHFEVSEIGREVHFIGRTSQGEFATFVVEPDCHFFGFPSSESLGLKKEAEEIRAAIKLLLAAIIRDFWVVEERQRVFEDKSAEGLPGIRIRREHGGQSRVLYLPRIRYAPSPNLKRSESELQHEARRAHFVTGHRRRAEQASAHQLILAKQYGISVPSGYTFVRPHERGGIEREIVYRSRSALQSLYEVDPIASQSLPDWFRFERDVARFMTNRGFSVEHIAAARNGDSGVDLYARRMVEGTEEHWVIQCKCFRFSRKVGPAVVRELIGTLAAYPAGAHGMIVTSSSFTPDALSLAQRSKIETIDGETFAKVSVCGQNHPPVCG